MTDTGYEPFQPPSEPVEPSGAEPFDLGPTAAPGASQGAPEPTQCQTAFLVVLGEDGHAYPELDLAKNYMAHRPPTPNDIANACGQINEEFTSMKIAAQIAQGLFQMQMQQQQIVMQQQEAQRIAQSLGLGPQPQVPGNRQQRRHG